MGAIMLKEASSRHTTVGIPEVRLPSMDAALNERTCGMNWLNFSTVPVL